MPDEVARNPSLVPGQVLEGRMQTVELSLADEAAAAIGTEDIGVAFVAAQLNGTHRPSSAEVEGQESDGLVEGCIVRVSVGHTVGEAFEGARPRSLIAQANLLDANGHERLVGPDGPV